MEQRKADLIVSATSIFNLSFGTVAGMNLFKSLFLDLKKYTFLGSGWLAK